ncbi:MAG: ATP-binding cassette domain-containing protein [Lachnospiraceae bacterium]|nr:ATP-binding cassette domain-containing protein [Lachnospiraceae bacterium]
MLIADNLYKSFVKNEEHGKKTRFNAVNGIDIAADAGEIVGILGPNGAGKTTLLRMLGGLMKPTSGNVVITSEGKRLSSPEEQKKHIGYLSGNTRLYGRLSVRELLTVIGELYELPKSLIEKRIGKISRLLDMESFIDNRIERLSTGQTQRASISRCLIHDPEIYIFDEPTLGLDILSSQAIVDFMKNERDAGKTVLYSTHYLEEAEYLCDKVFLLDKGNVVSAGSVEELLKLHGAANLREVFKKIMGDV